MKINLTIWLLLCLITFSQCVQVDLLEEFDPNEYSRQVGPEGGRIVFYTGSLPEDIPAVARELAILDIPPGALNEPTVFDLEYYGDFNYRTPAWKITPDITFNVPVTFSYRTQVLDNNTTEFYCYYRPYNISDQGDTVIIQDFVFDETENMVSVESNQFSGIYNYQLSLEFGYRAKTYLYCDRTNEEFLEIGLTNGLNGYGNLLVIPEGSINPPGYVFIDRAGQFPRQDGLLYREVLEIDQVTLLPNTEIFGYVYSINFENVDSSNPAIVYQQMDERYPFNYSERLNELKFYRIDMNTQTVLGEYPITIVNEDPYIFSTEVNESGTYLVGLPSNDFSRWLGGTVNVTFSGPENYTVTFDSDDFAGVDVFNLGFEDLLEFWVNKENGPKENSNEYIRFTMYYDQVFDYLEVVSFEARSIKFSRNGTDKSFIIYSGQVLGGGITQLDRDIGGKVIGTISTLAQDELGDTYDVTIEFDTKVYNAN